MKKIKVIHFMRRPRTGFNFSIEQIFSDVRQQLQHKVDFTVKASRYFNDGVINKLYNIIEAAFRQKAGAIAHITGEVHFLDFFMRKENILLTIHDCRFMQRKRGIQKAIMQWLYLTVPVKKAAYITTVSTATKKEIIRYTNCNAEKIKVIPVAVNEIFKPAPKEFNHKKPVILQVGTAENKNLSRLIEAVKDISCRLVIIGDVATADLEKLNQYKIDFVTRSKLSTTELYAEYVDCDVLAFISTYEGFGMPIIEANSVERVVITSNISSMPEVAGDAACLVNPFDTASVREGLMRIIRDEAYREQLISKGRINRLRFNSETISSAYYQLYKNIANR